ANIIESSQYSANPEGGNFFIRMEFECPGLREKRTLLETAFSDIAQQFNMEYDFLYVTDIKKTAIFVSKEPHCLMELLWEWQNGELIMDIECIISNYEDSREAAESLGIPFYYIPANKDIRKQVEAQQLEILKTHNIELIILARYMKILTPEIMNNYLDQIINIINTLLISFLGARPYDEAYDSGVKLIDATSHYVTRDLKESPIIAQGVKRVKHR